MKHIRTFEGYRVRKNREEIIKESVLQVNDIYKVKTMIDIPQSLINAYVKKVKDTTGKNLRQFFGDVDIAEEIIKYINLNNLDVEKIPGNALMGGAQSQGQGQPQGQPQIQTETETQIQPQGQAQTEAPEGQVQPQGQTAPEGQIQPQGQGQVQAQGQGQAQMGDFEEPQGQGQGQGQGQAQGQGQGQAQGQVQGQAQGEEEEEEELPL
jgi:hypothetical protein